MDGLQPLTDNQIIADAERAESLVLRAAHSDKLADAAFVQTVALEVARPTVKVAGGKIDTVSKVGRVENTAEILRS